MFTFEEKVVALSTIRTVGLVRAVVMFAKMNRCSQPSMREKLDEIESTHYLLEDGIVEKTNTGNIQYVAFRSQEQPNVISKEFFDKCKPEKQDALIEALSVLNCMKALGILKPAPLVRKNKFLLKDVA